MVSEDQENLLRLRMLATFLNMLMANDGKITLTVIVY